MPETIFNSRFSSLFYLTGTRNFSLRDAKKITFLAYRSKGSYDKPLSLAELEEAISIFQKQSEVKNA